MKNVAILGVSGSVGASTLKVLRQFPDEFRLVAFSVHTKTQILPDLIQEFEPEMVCISGSSHSEAFGKKFGSAKIVYGEPGLSEISDLSSVDILVTAIVGSIGAKPTITGIKAGKDIALANKETLVTFGPLIQGLLKNSPSKLLPVDSEHNALFQLLENKNPDNLRSLTLTASGGSFRDFPIESLKNVTIEQALKHPTWSMGPKITVDSAGMVNKGLEVIEAHYLFGIPYENIEVVIHPESIIHGLIETNDGAVHAYASYPDMIFPIAHSLFYPNQTPQVLREFKPFQWKSLRFWEPDPIRYPALGLAYRAGKAGGTGPAIFNAANEVACELFLKEKIPFLKIPEIIEETLGRLSITHPDSLEEYLDADQDARRFVMKEFALGVGIC
jgi:1-deoxy-D-xylulose-5-phosphate reductoisomerase